MYIIYVYLHRFPLYTKNLNNNRFVYGVFLLNKNIEQVKLKLI